MIKIKIINFTESTHWSMHHIGQIFYASEYDIHHYMVDIKGNASGSLFTVPKKCCEIVDTQNTKQTIQKIYFGNNGSYLEEDKVGDEIRLRVVQKNGDITYLK